MSKFSKPSQAYFRELRHVARAAQEVSDYLAGQPNLLPHGFPVEPTSVLFAALIQLPRGSTEGSVPILEAARDQLPTLRRIYIQPEPEEGEEPIHPDIPPVFRYGSFDNLINNLYIAIGTALDHYKSETGHDIDESTELDAPVETQNEFLISEAIASTIDAEQAISDFKKALDNTIGRPRDENEEELDRALVDADSQLKMGRAAASMPAPKPGLLARLGGYIRRTPEAMQTIGNFVLATADVIEPIMKAGLDILKESWLSVLSSIRTAASGIEESGRRMKVWRDGAVKNADTAIIQSDVLPPEIDLEKPRHKTPPFTPQSSPINAVRTFGEIVRRPGQTRAELDDNFGRNEVRDLLSLGLIKKTGSRIYPILEMVLEPELTVKNTASAMSSMGVARALLRSTPNASPSEIADAVALEIGRNWSKEATKRRYGNAIRRWAIWLEPFLIDPATGGEAHALAVNAMKNRVGKGRPVKITEATDRRIREMLAEGQTVVDIAKKLSISTTTIHIWKKINKL